MKNMLSLLIKIILIFLVAAWMVLIITEFVRYKNNEPMLFPVKENIINYDDGKVYVYYGLGYKSIIYERDSFYGKEFGHIFIKVRENAPD